MPPNIDVPQKRSSVPTNVSPVAKLNLDGMPAIKPNPATDVPPPRKEDVAKEYVKGALIAIIVGAALWMVPKWAILPTWALAAETIAWMYDFKLLGIHDKIVPPANKNGVYTWQDLAKHGSQRSAWIAIRGIVYDVTEFLDRHPGGKEMLLLCCGRDATDLFISYHPFTDKPLAYLPKMKIGTLATYEHPVYKEDSGFYRECAQKVKAFFDEKGLDHKNPWTGLIRMTPAYIVGLSAFYYSFLSRDFSWAQRCFLAIIVGVCQGIPLTGWMHDASHGSIGHSESWWWTVGRFALDFVSGSSMLSWRNQHVIGHHVYTNVMGADPDLPMKLRGDPRRLIPEQVYLAAYKFQHLYLPPLYGILGLKSRIQDISEVFTAQTNGPIRVNPISAQDYLRQSATKAIWAFLRFVVPIKFFGQTWGELIPLFLVSEFMVGYWLAFNFQVSHVSTECEFHKADFEKRDQMPIHTEMEQEWAHTQVKTSLDYSHNGKIATYFSGALNYQTAHHLFPTVSQYHYPAITPIIMETCQKYGLKYNVLPNYYQAISAHIKHLKNLGEQGIPAEFKLE